jgi:hypothetical protein
LPYLDPAKSVWKQGYDITRNPEGQLRADVRPFQRHAGIRPHGVIEEAGIRCRPLFSYNRI